MQVELAGLGLRGRGRHQVAHFGVSATGVGPALDGFEAPQPRLADISFDLSQGLGQSLQLSLTALAQLVTDGTSQDDQPFVADRLTVVAEADGATSPPVLRGWPWLQGKGQDLGFRPLA